MDLARYADSNGSDFNETFHHAWRYREYVIDSFNSDKAYDRFVEEQIAGDLMTAATDHQRAEQLVATGFLMLGPEMLSERDKAKLQMDVVDDQIDTIGRAMMGLTLGCARCHDHKFDPIPTSEYYALAGIFRSTDMLEGEIQKYVSDWIEMPLPADASRIKENNDFELSEKNLLAQIKKAENRLKVAKSQTTESDASIIVDDSTAKREGNWVESVYSRPFIGAGYIHDDNRDKGTATLTMGTRLPAGSYRTWMAYSAAPNRSRKTRVEFISHDVTTRIEVDQTKAPEAAPWEPVGNLTCDVEEEVVIVIRNAGSDGYVIADAIRFERLDNNGTPLPTKSIVASQPLGDVIKPIQEELDSVKEELKRVRAGKPAPLPMAMAVAYEPQTITSRIIA